MDAIREDPEWKGGEYAEEPKRALRLAIDLLIIAGSAPLEMQRSYPTRDAADKFLQDSSRERAGALDANDILYQLNASRNYDPSPHLEKISAKVVWINTADDFINPPELGIAEREAKRLKNGKFLLLPISEQTHGHGSHTWAVLWEKNLRGLLAATSQ